MTRTRRPNARILVISGPSGGGKTTVVEGLLTQAPGLVRSVSVTTRPRRTSERDGADYRFVSGGTFAQMRSRGRLLEWARVHRAWYGTPRQPVERALSHGRDVVLSIDVQGARQVKRRFGERAVLVFLVPPSLKALAQRLRKRRTETPQALQTRLRAAKRELACATWYDYTVINRRVQDAVEQIQAIVTAERLRTARW